MERASVASTIPSEYEVRVKRHRPVAIKALPQGFTDDLPYEDQRALHEVVGKQIMLNGYDKEGRAELEFVDRCGVHHTIWLDPKFIEPHD